MTRILYSDGGEKQSSSYNAYRKDRANCTVIALANATGLSYDQADMIAEAAGRQRNRGWFVTRILKAGGFPFTVTWHGRYQVDGTKRRLNTLAYFVSQHPRGRYILCTRRHAFALVDGIVLDTAIVGPRSIVTESYRLDGEEFNAHTL